MLPNGAGSQQKRIMKKNLVLATFTDRDQATSVETFRELWSPARAAAGASNPPLLRKLRNV
jgi:hypothetical protein